jgi:hypothetical protein
VTWTPLVSGSYNMQVWVRSAGSSASYEAWQGSGPFVVRSGPLKVVEVIADRAFPVGPGTAVTWTATSAGGDGTPVEYKFWRYSIRSRELDDGAGLQHVPHVELDAGAR